MILARGEVKALKEITRYECEVCGLYHNTPEEAQKCEGSHPKIEKTEYKYPLWDFGEATYPHAVEVSFADGTRIQYSETGRRCLEKEEG